MPAVRRAHQRSRIRPARQRLSRVQLLLVTVAGLAGLGLVVTDLAGSSSETIVELDQSGPYRLHSSAGPLEISAGPSALVRARASWLGRGPKMTTIEGSGEPKALPGLAPRRWGRGVEVSCDTRFPCRSAIAVELPAGAGVEALASGGPVLVQRFDGVALVETTDDHEVVLGLIEGTLLVVTEGGDITGHGLAAERVEAVTEDGEIELRFRERPRSVAIEAGDRSVLIVLPAGRYAVTVEGSRSAIIEVEQDVEADSRISITGGGPILVTSSSAALN